VGATRRPDMDGTPMRRANPRAGRPCCWLAAFVLAQSAITAAETFNDATALEWSRRLAKSQMAERGDALFYKDGWRARWGYTTGLFAQGLDRLAGLDGDAEMRAYAERLVSSFITGEGDIRTYAIEDYNIDQVAPGKMLFPLYERTREKRYLTALQLLRRQLREQPRTSEGGLWHKQRYPHQMWLDGVYMGAPFYAQYAKVFGEPEAFDDVVRQILLVDRHTYDAATGLHYHAWDESRQQEWADKATGRSPNFWGRAVGWYAMALVDTLDFLPADHPQLEAVVGVLRRVAEGASRHQEAKTGVWYQVLDQGGREGNYLEASVSSMYVYAIAKAINRGYLPRDRYLPVVRRAYDGLIRNFIRHDGPERISLTGICSVAGLGYGRDGSYEYYLSERVVANDLKGVGPFILAGIEVEQLLTGKPLAGARSYEEQRKQIAYGWDDMDAILARIQAPTFPDRDFDITQFGATPGGRAKATDAIRAALDAAHAAGGGRVVVPPGEFLTGAIHLKSNVNLHVSEGATLRFSTEPSDYPIVLTRWEGVELMNYSSLIYALDQENVAITGKGRLDGASTWNNWWAWQDSSARRGTWQTKGRQRLFQMGEAGVPVEQRVFGDGWYLRPNFVQFYRCKNVLIEGVHISGAPMWHVHPVLCTNVTVRGISIVSHGPNNDGCNPESSTDVLIEDCLFDTGDDCIAIKSGRNNDGRRIGVPSSNIIVRNSVMKEGHGGVVIGSEISGGCRNVFVENCRMDSPNLDRALRFKTNARRGGVIESVFMRDVQIGQVREAALTIDLLYEEGAKGDHPPIVRRVRMERIESTASPRVMFIRNFPGALIEDIVIADSTFRGVTATERLAGARRILLDNVTIEPRAQTPSSNSLPPANPAAGAATR
jgi:unsaturated rhamnogalacturonyl hydrolase